MKAMGLPAESGESFGRVSGNASKCMLEDSPPPRPLQLSAASRQPSLDVRTDRADGAGLLEGMPGSAHKFEINVAPHGTQGIAIRSQRQRVASADDHEQWCAQSSERLAREV